MPITIGAANTPLENLYFVDLANKKVYQANTVFIDVSNELKEEIFKQFAVTPPEGINPAMLAALDKNKNKAVKHDGKN